MEDTVDLETRIALIKKQKVFAQLNDEEITGLNTIFVEKHFKPNDTLVTEGGIVDSIFLIVTGRADVRRLFMEGTKVQVRSLALLGPGQAIGLNETGFYSLTGKRTASVVAISPLTALYLSVPRFHGFALANPRVNEVLRQIKRENQQT